MSFISRDNASRRLAGRAATAALVVFGAGSAFAQETPDPELVAEGENVFRRCATCHMVGEDARTRVGPVLNGVVGAPAAAHPDFRYSPAMIEAGEEGLVWTPETLDPYLEDPRGYVPGTKMAFAGLRDEGEREAVIAYLQTYSPDYDPAASEGGEAGDESEAGAEGAGAVDGAEGTAETDAETSNEDAEAEGN